MYEDLAAAEALLPRPASGALQVSALTVQIDGVYVVARDPAGEDALYRYDITYGPDGRPTLDPTRFLVQKGTGGMCFFTLKPTDGAIARGIRANAEQALTGGHVTEVWKSCNLGVAWAAHLDVRGQTRVLDYSEDGRPKELVW